MHGKAVSFSTRWLWVGYRYGWIQRTDDPVRFIDMRGSKGHGGEDMGYQSSSWFVEEEQYGYRIL